MKTLKPHPAALIYQLMADAQLDELAADIKAHGQRVPIILTKADLVLDGRNRLEACRRAAVEPDVQYWAEEDDGASPAAFVVSINEKRRHLNESQRAMAGARASEQFAKEAKARQRAGGSSPIGDKGKASERAAAAVGAKPRSVQRAQAILKTAPMEAIAAIDKGEKSLGRVERELKRGEQLKQVLEYKPPAGQFSVIVTDVPWQYDDALDGSDQVRGGLGYPPMPIEEILAIKVPAAADCALWFWTTTAFLIDGTASRVLAAWGFTPKNMLTWIKDRFGAGHYLRNQTETCILAVRGKPVIRGESQGNFFNAPRTSVHSEKPDAFYEIVERVCPAPDRLELFARKNRPGWITSGAELPKPSKKQRANMRFIDVENIREAGP